MSMERAIRIPVTGASALDADLTMPDAATGVAVFAHGSGSSRRSPRNRQVAATLVEAGFATVLADLLTAAEEQVDQRTRHLRFDIGLLADRVTAVLDWVAGEPDLGRLPVGLFGASTGAAAALIAAARMPATVAAIVSRGGRPDLAAEHLDGVEAPTLLIVGGRDHTVIELNRQAYDRLPGERRLEIVPGASHLFEEPGTLAQVAHLARDWFVRHL